VVAAVSAAVSLTAPMEAGATLPGTNGLVWTATKFVSYDYYGTFDPVTKAVIKTNVPKTDRTVARQVSFSGDASLVAFVNQGATTPHISVLSMSGGLPVDLTPGSTQFDANPSFCGDGTIVFERGGVPFQAPASGQVNTTLWAVSSKGGPARQITTGGTPPATPQEYGKGADAEPSCSQDGTVVFVRDYQLWKTTINGGTPTLLVDPVIGTGTVPDISPDGTRVLYLANPLSSSTPGRQLFTVPVAGGTPQPVAGVGTDKGFPESGASWSPDGKQLIYSRSEPSGAGRLYVLDVASATETLLSTDVYVAQVEAWSPSPLTPQIKAPPTYPVPTPTPTPGPTQPAQAAVLAALKSVGRPPKGTTLTKLLAKGAAVVTFKAPSAGTLTVKWSSPTGARAAAAKSTPIATARRTISTAGATKIKIKLTKAGKKALRQAKRAKRSLKVTSKAGFTPAGGTKTTATSRFKI
jgi:hypothetical protein